MPTLKLSPSTVIERARKTARGSIPPAGADPRPQTGLDGRDRRLIRQRLRRTRRVGDARVSELGVLAAEMQRRKRWNPAVLDEWTAELEAARRESRALEAALRSDDTSLADLVSDGVIAQCGSCGRLAGVSDTFCAGCGRELSGETRTPPAASEPDDGKTLTIL